MLANFTGFTNFNVKSNCQFNVKLKQYSYSNNY